MTFLSTRRT